MRHALCIALIATSALAADYTLGPDSQRHDGVPRGAVTHYTMTSSRMYPGTQRDYWIYIPAQYDAAKPACLMVFQDGKGFVNENGAWRVPVVFDNLIHAGAMPPTIGVFVDPGVLPARSPNRQDRFNRSFEYDALGDLYARFLILELLPEAALHANFSANPDDRAIVGSSSGGIAAFNAAFTHPEAFHRVLSFIGSYTDLRGADILPSLIRKMEPLPLRVFLQDGDHDLNIYAGNWYLGNQSMASALEFAGYESNFVVGTEGHNGKHGGAILPDALRWLWRDYPKPVAHAESASSDRHFVSEIADPSSDWEVVSQGHQFTEGPAVNAKGEVFFVDARGGKIFKIGLDGKVSLFKDDDGMISGLMFGVDGRLYAAQNGRKRIVAYTADGQEKVIAEGAGSNDLAVSSRGAIYFTDPADHRVWYIDANGAKRVVHEGLAFPNGVRFSPDESLLLVADSYSRLVWSFQVQPDGSLADAEPFYRLEMPDSVASGPLRSHPDGMTLDTQGYLYVATNLGIQICDQPGRVVAILRKPSAASPSNVVFGGPDLRTLYVTAGDKVFRRRLQRQGFFPWQPVKPPKPSL